MSKIIEKKILSTYYLQIENGDKTFELRLADWQCKPGDILVLKEIDDVNKEYTGRELRKKVGSVLKTKDINFYEDSDIEKFGYQIISLKDYS